MSFVRVNQYGRYMSFAESAAPANHLMDTVLPVRPAMIDRGTADRVKPGMVEELLATGSAKAMVLVQGQALLSGGALWYGDATALNAELGAAGKAPRLVIYLGRVLESPDGVQAQADSEGLVNVPILLFLLDEKPVAVSGILPQGTQWAGLREAAAQLDATHAALFVEASAIANWHSTHTHCPRCGAPTVVEAGGWVRRCPADGSEHYPRTDPAVIVTVVGPDGRLLLGGGGPADARNYSTLAGFVEPGESLEQAVVREIHEEVGVQVTACQYLGSQSWPFPASLMLGFTATTEETAVRPDGVEVTRARWFSREELQAAVLDGEITISTRLSIARSLIEHWYGGVIEDRQQ